MRTLVLALVLFCSPVFAFGELGHQMVCSMAYQLLSPVSQQKVQQLMQLHEQNDFTKACSWPDQVRSLPEYQHTKVWHYVNIQRSDTKLTMQHCPAEGCVLSAIEQQRKKLIPLRRQKPSWKHCCLLATLLATYTSLCTQVMPMIWGAIKRQCILPASHRIYMESGTAVFWKLPLIRMIRNSRLCIRH